MSKFVLILVIIIGVAIGLTISYMLKIPFAVWIIDTIKAKLSTLNIGGINIGSIASFASIIGLAGTAYSLIQSNKDKAEALTAAATQKENNQQLAEKLIQVDGIKTDLETSLTEANQLKDDALNQATSMKNELATTKEQLKNAMSQNDALQKINSGTIMDLWQKSGGEFWTDPITGEEYKLMNLERIIVK